MVVTILAWVMIAVFMAVVMTKKLSPLVALVTIPMVFAFLMLLLTGNIDKWTLLGDWVMNGIGTTANTGVLLLFAILYFSIMLDAGLFDPITKKMIEFAKGDPMKVLIATAVVAAAISLNGDGTTTTLVCCAAFLPIYEKLGMKKMNLAVLVILQNTIMNLLPWGGPTARAMAVTGAGGDILAYLMPGMIISVIFVAAVVAPYMGRKERARLGITEFSQAEIDELCAIDDPETIELRRPQNWLFNVIMTVVLIAWLVAGSFIEAIALPNQMLFIVGTIIALLVNYPNLKDQSARIGANGGDAVQVVILIFGAGIFMGLFSGDTELGLSMSDAIAQSLIAVIPQQLAGFWGLIVSLISAPGTFFISNDGFYFGVMPALCEAGYAYGFTPMQMALASVMGQAFHLLSPLTAFIYLLLRLTDQDLGEWQRAAGKWAAVIFVIFVVAIMATGAIPFYIPQQ